MSYPEIQIRPGNLWADGSVAEGETKKIIVQGIDDDGSTTDSLGGTICNQDYPTLADGPMEIGGHLIIDKDYARSTVYFGTGTTTSGIWCRPIIATTGVVDITGSGAYDIFNYITFLNQTQNSGVINVADITMYSGSTFSEITGPGTLNLNNVRLSGDNNNYVLSTIGRITGGQVINMTNSDLSLLSELSDVTIHMTGGSNYLALRSTATIRNVTVRGFGRGDIIDFASGSGADSWQYDPETGDLTVSRGTQSHTVNIGLGYDPEKFQSVPTGYLSNQGITYLDATPCFLSGSLIATPDGAVAIELLEPGDLVLCLEDGMLSPRPVQSIERGVMRVPSVSTLGDDERGFSVCIARDAIRPGVPYRDLRVTAEHCMALDGVLVPVRMLVNGRTIRYDTELLEYRYFHLRMETHALVLANGVLTETFLEEGHRSVTTQNARPGPIRPVLPIETGRARVEPIHRHLSARAEALGHDPAPVEAVGPCNSGEVHLVDCRGRRFDPIRRNGHVHVFRVPGSARKLRIASAVARPCDTIGPFVDDRRYLGALIGSISLYEAETLHEQAIHLENRALAGWSDLDSRHCRWTRGEAVLPLPAGDATSPRVLAIEILAQASRGESGCNPDPRHAA
ncbi:Hint domain-containing protein [Swaminathania salitolerans]|uniref:Hedgehog/Intein (Hint) domain-containing protein n=1 Tax=Swaminathania salitolerans TaxID=182838 RepID=A0A511BKM5_9PROT|nr:Hint domain-containing protein [Swaminathania salitolerans]GBQ09601.1 outer membrane protein [Swaminathania salitolerans LMG 21291]GEL00909.1 hypothetical protein SSA02_00720 [Swaminathania salitolerans]